ncbi:hypothetical protein SAMN05192553_103382 [Cyclobacterium xiamenense]|uniref:Uncharacterized protein n=1 Tax=Cyclobacterium xiamenense TaxID=1297121 RepID=A0A1H6Y0B9_9BACT|nr:hypothetical protein SAMN05192553_103382 [Cyclobacterium xiamenense]
MTEEHFLLVGTRFRIGFVPRLFPAIFGVISGFSVFYFLYFFGAYGMKWN